MPTASYAALYSPCAATTCATSSITVERPWNFAASASDCAILRSRPYLPHSLTSCSRPKRRCPTPNRLTSHASRMRVGSAKTPPVPILWTAASKSSPSPPTPRFHPLPTPPPLSPLSPATPPAPAGHHHSRAVVAPIAARQTVPLAGVTALPSRRVCLQPSRFRPELWRPVTIASRLPSSARP